MRYYARISFSQIPKLRLREINFPRYIHGRNQQATFCNTEDHLKWLLWSHTYSRSVTSSPVTLPHTSLQSHRCPCSSSDMPNMSWRQVFALAIPKVLKGLPQLLTCPYFTLCSNLTLPEKPPRPHTHTVCTTLRTLDCLALSTTWQTIYLLFFFFIYLLFNLLFPSTVM